MARIDISRRAFSAGVLSAGVLQAVPAFAQAETLKVRLDWTPWGVHGAIHLAQAKGWLAGAGLNVDVQDGNGSAATVQFVGGSSEFDLGHASLATMMVARSKGLSVRAAAVFARQGDIGCFVPKTSGIAGPADLKGKKIIYTAGALEAPFIDTFLAAGGLKKGDVELVAVSAASKASTYASGQADAALSTIPFFLAAVADARPSNAIRFADYKLEMPGYGLLAQESTLTGPKRDAVSKYCSIVAATWKYIYDGHQEEAVEAIISQRPQARLDRKVLRGQIDSLQGFLDTAAGKTLPFGVITVVDWDIAVRTLSAAGLVAPESKGSDYVELGLVKPIELQAARL
ncbi:ABC transporter substrate-binding protein [Bradyrhizobium sp. LTSP857]|uniref:ABC transporter substrate-binding protein n=1 Tax=Bradyrhizobium sp. LTSP857 TaxID=1619231 RepID=UPI0005E01C47|nr:ABC transporter substrate-binding protein [Bradyrhizobium sp. LTSP857]KJC47567.1 NMT1/THI5-like family protein 3 [Bradyrhizobium sp. LTSP857]